jgi:hypothetical protein
MGGRTQNMNIKRMDGKRINNMGKLEDYIPQHITPPENKYITVYVDNRFIIRGKIEQIDQDEEGIKIDIKTGNLT